LAKVTKVRYCTPEKLALISKENKDLYEKYLKSSIIKNKDVEHTSYKIYKNYFYQFLVFIAEKYNNLGLYSEDFFNNAVDIMEDFMSFCSNELQNHKKVINTKLSAVSTFYLWSMKRRLINSHPFDKKLDRMKGANEEKIINSYFLNDEQVKKIMRGLLNEKKYDTQDQLIFSIMLDSANRVGAIHKLTLSSLDLDSMVFNDIREKRGYKVEVAFSESTKDVIEEWLEMRKDLDNLQVDSLFITKQDGQYKQMGYTTIQNRVRKIGEIVGLSDFHAHCVRKSKLNDIYTKTGDLMLAAEYANHKGTEVTKLYIKPKSKTEIRDKIKELSNKEINSK
jgi:integrase/recombinase XerC